MQKIIPVYYSEYGRYINRFRAIPFYIDCLKPVERRILLVLHEVARNKLTKSAKVVGTTIGSYHPHGDQSCYETLVNLVQQDFATGQGNWGSPGLIDAEAASFRYTECKLNAWVEELAFKYIDFVPWMELETIPEPLYLPSPVPLGLIGDGVITGISFYRTLVPKYKLQDLIKRLIWLLDNNKIESSSDLADLESLTLTEEIAGPCIQPNIKSCQISEDQPNQFYSLLFNGVGSINVIPNGKIDGKTIKILGRAPNASFNSLREKKDKLEIHLNCLSKKEIEVEVIPRKRGTNLTELGTKIWNDYLIKKMNFNCIVCDNDGVVDTVGIDSLISNSYRAWKYAVLLKNVDDYEKLTNKKFELLIVQIIRYIIEQIKANKVSEIIDEFKKLCKSKSMCIEVEKYNVETAKWSKHDLEITDKNIEEVCNKKNIRSLIETTIDIKKVEQDLLLVKNLINNVDNNCYKYIKEL